MDSTADKTSETQLRQLQFFSNEVLSSPPSPREVPAAPPPPNHQNQTVTTFVWVVREMPRSWHLELQPQTIDRTGPLDERCWQVGPLKYSSRLFRIHGAMMRQLHGLTTGGFSLKEIPVALLRGPTSTQGVFYDRDLNPAICGVSNDERRSFNQALRDVVKLYLAGADAWPTFPCPSHDRWTAALWESDQRELALGFCDLFQVNKPK